MTTLVILAVAGTLLLTLFFVFQIGFGDKIKWAELLFQQRKSVDDFQIGDVVLGMKPDALQSIHPNLDLRSLVEGEKVATFDTGGARYSVWFVNIRGVEKAYRIRFDQVISGKTESDIVEDIGRRHGKPGTSECSKTAAGQRKCHFQWWPSGGIALNVLSSTKKIAGNPVTAITMIATDTYLDGKRIRNQGR